jgi:hypothetical protein
MTQISTSFCYDASAEPIASPGTDALPLYVLIEEGSGLYFVDGDEPRVSVTVECNGKKVKSSPQNLTPSPAGALSLD